MFADCASHRPTAEITKDSIFERPHVCVCESFVNGCNALAYVNTYFQHSEMCVRIISPCIFQIISSARCVCVCIFCVFLCFAHEIGIIRD